MHTKQFYSVVKKIAITALLVVVFACDAGSYKEDLMLEPVDVSEEYDGVQSANADTEFTALMNSEERKPAPDLKIIKSANAKYKVENVRVSTARIKGMAQKFDAYVSDQRFQNNLYQIENRFTVKVPQEHFDELMDSIRASVSFVEYENVTTKDVSEEYVDLQSRLKTKMEVKARYEAVLRQNAKTVKDILLTEEKLRVLQEEIESAEGRLKYLTNKVAYSTIQIDLYETVDYKEEPVSYKKSFVDKSKNGFSFGWNMVEATLLFFIHMWPLIILGSVFFFFLRKWMRK